MTDTVNFKAVFGAKMRGQLGHRRGLCRQLGRLRVGGQALRLAVADAVQDGGQPEQLHAQVERPVVVQRAAQRGRAVRPGEFGITPEHRRQRWDARWQRLRRAQAAQLLLLAQEGGEGCLLVCCGCGLSVQLPLAA